MKLLIVGLLISITACGKSDYVKTAALPTPIQTDYGVSYPYVAPESPTVLTTELPDGNYIIFGGDYKFDGDNLIAPRNYDRMPECVGVGPRGFSNDASYFTLNRSTHISTTMFLDYGVGAYTFNAGVYTLDRIGQIEVLPMPSTYVTHGYLVHFVGTDCYTPLGTY